MTEKKPTPRTRKSKKAEEVQEEVVVMMEEPVVQEEAPSVEENAQDTVVVEPKEEKPAEDEVTASLDAPVDTAKSQTNVRVATNRDHSCVIGGVRYMFYKGKQQPVPVHVKETLMEAGLLLPL